MTSIVKLIGCVLMSTIWAAATAQTAGAPRYTAGESWAYTEMNQFSRSVVGSIVREVTHADGRLEIDTHNGAGVLVAEALLARAGLQSGGTLSSRAAGSLDPALELLPFPLKPGQEWKQTVMRDDPYWREKRAVTLSGRVEDWELVSVPAGEFRTVGAVDLSGRRRRIQRRDVSDGVGVVGSRVEGARPTDHLGRA